MLNVSRALIVLVLSSIAPAWAVYAPVPEQEQGKDLVITLKGGVSYDSNLFGAPDDEVSSAIFTFAPRAVYNRSLTDQTFLSASYGLMLDKFENRPGDTLLDSHDATLRVAHAFTRSTIIDLTESFTASRNPESLLAGVPLNPDQSFNRNQLDGRFETPLTPKSKVTIKARSVCFDYRNAALGRALDRIENLYGVSGDYALVPEMKLVGEYRHQDVFYRKLGETKNKRSDYVMGGVDYDVARKLSVSSRLGVEWRRRAAERDTTAPYAELSAKYDYREKSFLVGGLAYTFDETSDIARYNDSKVQRYFINLQHAVTGLIVASGSLSYEPAVLQGRRGVANIDEDTIRAGVAVSYLPTTKWTLSASFDYDDVSSDEPLREMRRERVALHASYTF